MHKRLNLNQHSSLRTAQTQHRTVLIVVHFILQTIIIAHMMSTGGEGTETLRAVHTECGAEQYELASSLISMSSITADAHVSARIRVSARSVNDPLELHIYQ